MDRRNGECVRFFDGITMLPLRTHLCDKVELHSALLHTRREKVAKHEEALAAIQDEEDKARDMCKVCQ